MKPQTLWLAMAGLAALTLPDAAFAGVVGLGPVRIDQKDITDARNIQDPHGEIVVQLRLTPAAGARTARGLVPFQMKPVRIALNGRALTQQVIETTDDGQLVIIHGPMTDEAAATLALKLSGRPPAPTRSEM